MKFLLPRKFLIFIFFLTACFLLTGIVHAQQENAKLTLKTTAEKEVKTKKDGKIEIKRIPLEKATPGDIVIYTITYTNSGKGPVVDAVIVDPVPAGVSYIENTAEGKDAEITYSIDNGLSWHKPPITTLFKKPDGTMGTKNVTADQYKHIKWALKKPVPAGQSGQVSFKVKVK